MGRLKNPALRMLWDYGVIALSCAVYAAAFNCFFQPNNIAMGGFTGVVQIFTLFLPALPVGTTVLVMNVPLLTLAVKKQGARLLVRTLFAIAVSSLFIDLMALLYTFPATDPLLSCIYGGVLLGISAGMMMRQSATTGGTELLARLLKYRIRGLSIGRLCLVIDVLVVLAYSIAFGHLNNALYGIIAMYICSLAMDMVVYGQTNAKMAYIISDHSDEITQWLLDRDMGVTLLQGKGAFTGDEKKVVLCAFKRGQIVPIKAAVTRIDPNAFVIVCEAHEVLGEGFGEYTPESL